MVTGAETLGYLISALIQTAVHKATGCALLLVGLQCGLDQNDLFRLVTSMTLAFALVAKAQSLPIPDDNFARLLVQLKGVIYDADDFLGGLEQQHSEHQRKCGSILGLLYHQGCFFKHEDDAVGELRKIQSNLDLLTLGLKGVIEVHSIDHSEKQAETSGARFKPETSPLLLPKHVFGREQEKEKIVDLLLNSCKVPGDVPIITILGPPGMGKTTTAQVIWNDPRVQAHFDICMWVHTAFEHFDVLVILKEILQYLPCSRHPADLTNLGNLQKIVMEELKSKRFLLVFDDMWEEDQSKLENLIGPLMYGLDGSKILVTTQSRKVSDTIGATESVVLDPLLEETMLLLFEKHAFGSRNSENHPMLKAIGKEIVRKFEGSPLAAKTLGRKLHLNFREEYWRIARDTELIELSQGENDVIQVIKPSYSRLPPQLQQCVSFCSLFPKKDEFDEESTVQMWIANDYIKPEGGMRIEDVGSRYFDELVDRYFFQKLSHGAYIWHPLMRDLAQDVSKDDFITIKDGDSRPMVPDTVRHLSVQDRNMGLSQFTELCRGKKLRTLLLFVKFGPDLGSALGALKSEISSVRVLDLGTSDVEKLPGNACNWKQLRYFDATGTKLRSLPESFCRFQKLQVLKVLNGFLVRLPGKVSQLITLRHLNADISYVSQIEKIGRLTFLQELKQYKVLDERGHMIGELKDMNELRGRLQVSNLENVRDDNDACQAKLMDKRHLDELSLEWGSNRKCSRGTDEHDAKVLEGLKPHPNLRVLEINSYAGRMNPTWLTDEYLSKLESVSFRNCSNLQSFPSKLSMIRTLKHLIVDHCPNLKSLPENGLPQSLLSFQLRNCPELKEMCRKDDGADWNKIAHIASVHFDELCISQVSHSTEQLF